MTDSVLRQREQTVAAADEHDHDIWAHVQRGLVYPAPHAVFATFWADETGAPLTFQDMAGDLNAPFRTSRMS